MLRLLRAAQGAAGDADGALRCVVVIGIRYYYYDVVFCLVVVVVCIYIYIYRERERCVCIYIYIYTHTYVYMYVHYTIMLAHARQCLWKKHLSGEDDALKRWLEKHQIRGWRGVFAAALQGQGSRERGVSLFVADAGSFVLHQHVCAGWRNRWNWLKSWISKKIKHNTNQ